MKSTKLVEKEMKTLKQSLCLSNNIIIRLGFKEVKIMYITYNFGKLRTL